MDMDVTWISFNHSVYDLYRNTCNIFAASGGPELVMIKNVEMSHCVVDSWWYHGTGPGCAGCRYVKYPQSHKVQTQNLDMPWFWYALLHCAQVYGAGPFEFECLNTCNGPETYVDHLMKDPYHGNLTKLWVHDCYDMHLGEIKRYTNLTTTNSWEGKYLNLEMNWGNRMNFSESFKNSVSVHLKDSDDMISWLNQTVELMMHAGCTEQSCFDANITLMRNLLI